MIEIHPFELFAPENARYLVLGSFTGRQVATDESYDWYYGTKRNQFWPILERVYCLELKDQKSKQDLFTRLGMAIADIIYQCERIKGSNLDANLKILSYKEEAISSVLNDNPIEKIFFTSQFVGKHFRKVFKEFIERHPETELIPLPSPSPRYALMTFDQKVERYKELLPRR